MESNQELKKYCVTVTRVGYLPIIATNEKEAMDIANHQKTSSVYWSDDWKPTDCVVDDNFLDNNYIEEKAF